MKQSDTHFPEAQSASEADLILLARAGQLSAFTELFRIHKNQVYSLCLDISNSAEQAEYCTQRAFIEVFRRLLALHSGDIRLSAWLCRVAAAIALIQRRESTMELPGIAAPTESNGEPGTIYC